MTRPKRTNSGSVKAPAISSNEEMGSLIQGSVFAPENGESDSVGGLAALAAEVPETVAPIVMSGNVKLPEGLSASGGKVKEKTDAKPTAVKKAELVERVAQLETQLASERARNGDVHVERLASTLEMFTYIAFGIAAETRGPHWAMAETEAKQIAGAGSVAMAPYAEDMADKLPWLLFAGVVGKAVYTRAAIDLAAYRAEKARQVESQ